MWARTWRGYSFKFTQETCWSNIYHYYKVRRLKCCREATKSLGEYIRAQYLGKSWEWRNGHSPSLFQSWLTQIQRNHLHYELRGQSKEIEVKWLVIIPMHIQWNTYTLHFRQQKSITLTRAQALSNTTEEPFVQALDDALASFHVECQAC